MYHQRLPLVRKNNETASKVWFEMKQGRIQNVYKGGHKYMEGGHKYMEGGLYEYIAVGLVPINLPTRTCLARSYSVIL